MERSCRWVSRTTLLFVFVAIAGCASSKVTSRDAYQGGEIAKPDRIIVYDFAVTPADLPSWSDAATSYGQRHAAGSDEEIDVGRKLGAQIARELITRIRAMGLTAVSSSDRPTPAAGDAMLVGYFESIEEGDAGKRVMLGFGAGASDLKTRLEGYVMTDQGPRRAGGGAVEAEGGKGPGMLAPIAVVAATSNPIGLIVGGAMHARGEIGDKSTIEGMAEDTAETIAKELEAAFKRRGWI